MEYTRAELAEVAERDARQGQDMPTDRQRQIDEAMQRLDYGVGRLAETVDEVEALSSRVRAGVAEQERRRARRKAQRQARKRNR